MGDYIKRWCNPEDNHTYLQVSDTETNSVIEFKMRLGTGSVRSYMKINYLSGYTQVWKGRNNSPRHKIDEVLEVDVHDTEQILKKINTYVNFS